VLWGVFSTFGNLSGLFFSLSWLILALCWVIFAHLGAILRQLGDKMRPKSAKMRPKSAKRAKKNEKALNINLFSIGTGSAKFDSRANGETILDQISEHFGTMLRPFWTIFGTFSDNLIRFLGVWRDT